MAKPHKEYAKKLAEIFAKQYNQENQTNFQWLGSKSYQGKDKEIDFILYDGEIELSIQHTIAVSDPMREFVRPNKVAKVIYPIIKDFENNPRIPQLFIHINMHDPPISKKEIDDLIFWLKLFIEEKVTNPEFSLYSYDADDEQILPHIKKYIDRLIIKPYTRDKGDKVVFGYGSSEREIKGWLNDAQRVIKAIERKQNTKSLLLIDTGMWGVHSVYETIIKDYCVAAKPKEIWLVEPYLGRERALKIK